MNGSNIKTALLLDKCVWFDEVINMLILKSNQATVNMDKYDRYARYRLTYEYAPVTTEPRAIQRDGKQILWGFEFTLIREFKYFSCSDVEVSTATNILYLSEDEINMMYDDPVTFWDRYCEDAATSTVQIGSDKNG